MTRNDLNNLLNEVQWRKREWLLTNATFGCNGYKQIDND
jgi:hypothetical protein